MTADGNGGTSGGSGGGGGEGVRSGDDDGVADIEQSIDRYDYLISFPNPSERGGQCGGGSGDEEVRVFRNQRKIPRVAVIAQRTHLGDTVHTRVRTRIM